MASKRVVVVVQDRHSCPFRIPERYEEECGPPGPRAECRHPKELARLETGRKARTSGAVRIWPMPLDCQTFVSLHESAVGFPTDCPLADGDVKETP